MPNPQPNITQIPSNRVEIIDSRTGMVSREWYRFFLNLFNLAGSGGNQTSLDDLQIGPPPQPVTASGGGSGTVTSVDVSGGTTGLTTSGGPVTSSGTITLAGTLAVASGGTGATTAINARSNLSAAQSGANTDITSIALTSGTVTTAPSSSSDLVNKSYADSIASGVNFHAACNYATTAALASNTYNNGASGVGATLTAVAVGTLTIDGYTFVVGDVNKRILVKNEVTGANNGIYTLTQAGTALLPYILTRATDYDTSGSGTNEIDQGDLVLVLAGTTNANTSWVQQTALPITVGTTALVFIQFAAVQTYTAGTGLTLTTNQFSITNTGTSGTYGSATAIPVFVTNAQGQVTSVTNTTATPSVGSITGLGTGVSTFLATPTSANLATAVTDETGSGSLVFATSPTLVTPILGTPQSGNFSTGTFTWPTFNQNTTGSAATLTTGRTIAITGDLAYTSPSFDGSTNVTAAGTLATVNTNVGSFTNATLTVNGKGLITAASSGTAPVTSVTGTSPIVSSGGATPAISLAANYGDTLNPYASKTANYFLAAPNGTAGAPTFRAVVAADIPTLNQNTTGSAATLTTARAIYGNNFDGSAALAQIIASTYGGTGNGFTKFSGATTAEKTYSLPDASTTILTTNAAVTIAQGGTGQTTQASAFNALSPITSTGDLILGNGTNSATRLAIGANGYVLTSNGTTASWAAGGGSGATITNDVATSTNVYPVFANAISGTFGTAYTSNANYLYKPSTGELTAVAMISSNGIQVNANTVATSYTIATGNNGLSAGPVSVNSGITVTVSSGSTWSVV
jgi:hypothetical protein